MGAASTMPERDIAAESDALLLRLLPIVKLMESAGHDDIVLQTASPEESLSIYRAVNAVRLSPDPFWGFWGSWYCARPLQAAQSNGYVVRLYRDWTMANDKY